MPSYISPDGNLDNMIYAAIGCAIAFGVAFAVSFVLGIKEDDEETPAEKISEKPAEEIILTNSKVFAPIDCEVTATYDSKHALELKGSDGVEILIHVGIDTVQLGRMHCINHVQSGQYVKKGDLLLEFDKSAIEAEDYNTVVPVILINTPSYKNVNACRLTGCGFFRTATKLS